MPSATDTRYPLADRLNALRALLSRLEFAEDAATEADLLEQIRRESAVVRTLRERLVRASRTSA